MEARKAAEKRPVFSADDDERKDDVRLGVEQIFLPLRGYRGAGQEIDIFVFNLGEDIGPGQILDDLHFQSDHLRDVQDIIRRHSLEGAVAVDVLKRRKSLRPAYPNSVMLFQPGLFFPGKFQGGENGTIAKNNNQNNNQYCSDHAKSFHIPGKM